MKKILFVSICIFGTGLVSFAQTEEGRVKGEPVNRSNVQVISTAEKEVHTTEPQQNQPEVKNAKVEVKERNLRPTPVAIERVKPVEKVEKKEIKKD